MSLSSEEDHRDKMRTPGTLFHQWGVSESLEAEEAHLICKVEDISPAMEAKETERILYGLSIYSTHQYRDLHKHDLEFATIGILSPS